MLRSDALSVLIVDDDRAYVDFIRQILSDAKGQRFEVEAVTHLARVLPSLEARKINVMLLDVQLPDGNGLEWLRANRARVQAAVVVMTGHAEYDVAEEIAPGAQDFLLKNQVDRYQLVRAIRYAAERQRAQQQLIRSREYFQSLIDHARDLITVVDDRGIILYQSPSSEAVLGLTPQAVVDRYLSDFIPPGDVSRARALLAAAFEGNAAGAAACGRSTSWPRACPPSAGGRARCSIRAMSRTGGTPSMPCASATNSCGRRRRWKRWAA
jgi:FixJ family two-component response regulator